MSSLKVALKHRNATIQYISLLSSSGIANEQKKLYGTQFHPEVDLTERGMEMLRNFLFEIAGCTNNFTVQNRQQTCINDIREKVDKSKVLVSETVLSVCVCFYSNQKLDNRTNILSAYLMCYEYNMTEHLLLCF